jgi:hypothetical protein
MPTGVPTDCLTAEQAVTALGTFIVPLFDGSVSGLLKAAQVTVSGEFQGANLCHVALTNAAGTQNYWRVAINVPSGTGQFSPDAHGALLDGTLLRDLPFPAGLAGSIAVAGGTAPNVTFSFNLVIAR